jgi:hypothetical protein
MKVLYDYNSKSVLTLPNLTCKRPSEYENKHWEVLKDADCSTSVSPTVMQTTEGSVSVSVASSSVRNSAISKDTEKPADNIAPPIDTSSVLWIAIISSMGVFIVVLGLVFALLFRWLYLKVGRLETNRQETNRQETASLVSCPEHSTKTVHQEHSTNTVHQEHSTNTNEKTDSVL